MIVPREYQVEAIESVISRSLMGITRQLICLPTGTGKTVVFALLAKELGLRTLVIAHTDELISQAVEKFKMVWPDVDIGVVKAESDQIDSQIVVASIQTSSKKGRLQKLKQQNFALMIIDEAHHASSDSYVGVIKALGFLDDSPQKLLVGVTATPRRGDGVGLNTVFQEITFERSVHTMIRAGYLSPLIGKQVFTKIELQGVGTRSGDFIPSELSRLINTETRNQLIVSSYKHHAHDRKRSLAFCIDIKHAQALSDTFNSNGIPSAAIHGRLTSEERAKILDDFANGCYRVLTNCQLLTEGFDEPSIDCVIMGRPTQSSALFTQMVGRGTRTFPFKSNCFILDFTDNASKHGLCTYQNTLDSAVANLKGPGSANDAEEYLEASEASIDRPGASDEVRVYEERSEDIEFFDKTHFAWNSVGNNWHLRLGIECDVWIRPSGKGFSVVTSHAGAITKLSSRPLPLGYALGVAEDWARKQKNRNGWAKKNAAWRLEPATPKQLGALSKFRFAINSNLSKGEAAALLDTKINEPATPRQLGWLRCRGIPIKHPITKLQARKIIAQSKGG